MEKTIIEYESFRLKDNDRLLLSYYCHYRSYSYISKFFESLLLLDGKMPISDIENKLSIHRMRLDYYIKIYNKTGLEKLLEYDKINRYDISFDIRQYGWMDLCFKFDEALLKINLNSVFDPIPDILEFIESIINDENINTVNIDEEGHFKTLKWDKVDVFNKELYCFKIVSSGMPYPEYEFNKVVYKSIFINKFINALIDLANKSDNLRWFNYNLPEFVLLKIEILQQKIDELNKKKLEEMEKRRRRIS
jgi:hypothetical protein